MHSLDENLKFNESLDLYLQPIARNFTKGARIVPQKIAAEDQNNKSDIDKVEETEESENGGLDPEIIDGLPP